MEHERLVRMIKESISLMCKSSLNYELELNVEGLLGITLDKKDIFWSTSMSLFRLMLKRQYWKERKKKLNRQRHQRKDIMTVTLISRRKKVQLTHHFQVLKEDVLGVDPETLKAWQRLRAVPLLHISLQYKDHTQRSAETVFT